MFDQASSGETLIRPDRPLIRCLQKETGVHVIGEPDTTNEPTVIFATDALASMTRYGWNNSFNHNYVPKPLPDVRAPAGSMAAQIEVEPDLQTKECAGFFFGKVVSRSDGLVHSVEHHYFVPLPDSLHEGANGAQVSFNGAHDFLEKLLAEAREHDPNIQLTGWYHTHPDMGAWFSPQDRQVHQHFQAYGPLMGIVHDPIGDMGVFSAWGKGRGANKNTWTITREAAKAANQPYEAFRVAQFQEAFRLGTTVADLDHQSAVAAGETLFDHKGFYEVSRRNFEGPLSTLSQADVMIMAHDVAEGLGLAVTPDLGDIDLFEPPLEFSVVPSYIQDRLKALGVTDPDTFMTGFNSDLLLQQLQVTPEMAENLAARILKQMELAPALRQVEIIPTRGERLRQWTKSVVQSFVGTPEEKGVFDALIATPQFENQAQRLQDLFGREARGFDTTPELIAACRFLYHLDQAHIDQGLRDAIVGSTPDATGAIQTGEAAASNPGAGGEAASMPGSDASDLIAQINIQPIEQQAPVKLDLGDFLDGTDTPYAAASAAEQEAGGGNWPARAQRLRQVESLLAQKQSLSKQREEDKTIDEFDADGLQLNAEITALQNELEKLLEQFKTSFGVAPGGVFFDVFGDADGGSVDTQGTIHRLILKQRDNLVALAIDYFAGKKHEDDLAQWHSDAGQALQGLRNPKMTDEELVRRMVEMKK